MTTLRELLDAVQEADDAAEIAKEAAREAEKELERRKAALLSVMQEQGTDIVRKEGFTVTLKIKRRTNVFDWDTFYNYLITTNSPQLLERRVSSKAYDEAVEARNGEHLPGCSIFEYPALQTRRG